MIDELRRKLKLASFRDVHFYVESHNFTTGRQLAQYDFIGHDIPSHDDVRKLARIFSFEAFVLGPNFLDQANELIDACELKGPGKLVHPFLGTFNGETDKRPFVRCTEVTLTGTKDRLGYATLSLSFVETADEPEPVELTDFERACKDASDALNENAATDFTENAGGFDLTQTVNQITSDIENFNTWMASSVYAIPEAFGDTAVGEFIESLDGLQDAIGGAIFSVDGSVSWIQGKIEGIKELSFLGRAKSAYAVLKSMMGWGSDNLPSFGTPLDYIPQTTDNRTDQQANRDALADMIHRMAVSEMARVAIDDTYYSREEAEYIRGDLVKHLDVEILRAGDCGDDDSYFALRDLRARVSQAIANMAGELPQINTYQVPAATVPALVLAYDLYEDLDREEEILERNPEVYHPGFLPQGTSLEVLSS